MSLRIRKTIVIGLIGAIFLAGNVLLIANWLSEKGVPEKGLSPGSASGHPGRQDQLFRSQATKGEPGKISFEKRRGSAHRVGHGG